MTDQSVWVELDDGRVVEVVEPDRKRRFAKGRVLEQEEVEGRELDRRAAADE